MCNCLHNILDNLPLQDSDEIQSNDFENMKKTSKYALIHCTQSNWKNIEIPMTYSSDKTSDDSKLSSGSSDDSVQYSIIKNWNFPCNCNDLFKENESSEKLDEKFNVIPQRLSSEEEHIQEDSDDIECTLAIIKPEAMKYRNSIEKRIINEGFEICHQRILQLSPEETSEFYSNEYGKLHFPSLTVYMSSGPICALVLAKSGAVKSWRKIIGPKDVNEAKLCFPNTIRAIFGEKIGEIQNVVHGSLTREEAIDEIHFFFPNFIVEPLLQDKCLENYLRNTFYPILTEGLAQTCKEKPANPLLWFANWLSENDPTKPKILIDSR